MAGLAGQPPLKGGGIIIRSGSCGTEFGKKKHNGACQTRANVTVMMLMP